MKKTKTSPTAVAAQAAQAVQDNSAPIDWSQYSGDTGFETVSQSDLGIPFIVILQPKSAEVDRTHPKYAMKKVEGAGAGDIFNSVAREVMVPYGKSSLSVIPCGYEKTWNEWKKDRAGLVRIHRNEDIRKDVTGKTDKNEDILRNGNLLIETAMFYVLIPRPGDKPLQAVIPMQSTGLKQARSWLNILTGLRIGPNRIQPPFFSHSYKLTAAIDSNAKGSWYAWNITIEGPVNDRALVADAAKITQNVVLLVRQAKGLLNAPQPPTAEDHDEVPM